MITQYHIHPVVSTINAKINKHETYISNLLEIQKKSNEKDKCSLVQEVDNYREVVNDLKRILESVNNLKYND